MIEFWSSVVSEGGATDGAGDEQPSHRHGTDHGSEP
jgi:hypothetical protein